MKIGLVLDTTIESDAGVQQYFKGLARFLLADGHEIRFLTPPSSNKGEFKDRIITFGKNITPPGSTTSVPTVFNFSSKKIIDVLKKEKFDILHVAAPFSPFLGGMAIRHAECPIVITYLIHTQSLLHKIFLKVLRALMLKTYNKIDAYIAVSRVAKNEAEDVMPGEYSLVPIGIDLSKYSPDVRPLAKFDDDILTILFLGRLELRKGVNYLIKAYSKVITDNPELKTRLVIAGDGPEREELEAMVRQLELQDFVLFEGFIDETKKPNYYASADLCVFPAIYGESFGVVLIEAMASGKVTLGYGNDGYSFVLRDVPELIVEKKNIDDLATKMTAYLKDEKLRKKYEKRCLEVAHSYNWESVGKQVVSIYKRVLEK